MKQIFQPWFIEYPLEWFLFIILCMYETMKHVYSNSEDDFEETLLNLTIC